MTLDRATLPKRIAESLRSFFGKHELAIDISNAAWVLRDGAVLASLVVADSYGKRAKGLLGRASYEGAMLITGTSSIHTLGMKMTIDVAFIGVDGQVCSTIEGVKPWRITRRRRGACAVLEAEAGSFQRWELAKGNQLEFK